MTTELSFKPLKQNLWTDLEELFGPRGACAGCWCMYWKLRGKAYEEARGIETRQMHYLDGDVVGWVAVEPRSAYPRLAHSRILQPVDDQTVWSITCFFVSKKYRRMGITIELLKAAVEHVRCQGGTIVEGYPVETRDAMPAPFIYTGTASAYQQAGFQEVARRAPTRPIFRYIIQ